MAEKSSKTNGVIENESFCEEELESKNQSQNIKDYSHEDVDNELENSHSYLSPDVLLNKLQSERQNISSFTELRDTNIRCLALNKILYGENSLEVAESHLELAKTYIRKRYYPMQTLKHADLTKSILSDLQHNSHVSLLLQSMYLVMGKANILLGKVIDAEKCLEKAKYISDNNPNATTKHLNVKILIFETLAQILSKGGQYGQAVEYIEQAVELAFKMSGDQSPCLGRLYKQLTSIELLNNEYANVLTAYEAAMKALEQFTKEPCNSQEIADVNVLLTKVELRKEFPDYEKAQACITEAEKVYRSLNDSHKTLSVRKMACKVLIQEGKLKEAKTTLISSIKECEVITGDMSLQCGEFYEMIGSLLFNERKPAEALGYLTQAQEIYSGKRMHKEKLTKLEKIISIIRKAAKDEKLKTTDEKLSERPRFT